MQTRKIHIRDAREVFKLTNVVVSIVKKGSVNLCITTHHHHTPSPHTITMHPHLLTLFLDDHPNRHPRHPLHPRVEMLH
jgi:hypothetical protein